MNFKLVCLIIILSYGCGVKGPPRPPAGTAVPSYIDTYLKKSSQTTTNEDQEVENSKNKEKK